MGQFAVHLSCMVFLVQQVEDKHILLSHTHNTHPIIYDNLQCAISTLRKVFPRDLSSVCNAVIVDVHVMKKSCTEKK